jgi:hypothetical protein
MILQLISKQGPAFCINIEGTECMWYPPGTLFRPGQLIPVKATVKGSTLGWYINRQFVSYNQLKTAILNGLPPTLQRSTSAMV